MTRTTARREWDAGTVSLVAKPKSVFHFLPRCFGLPATVFLPRESANLHPSPHPPRHRERTIGLSNYQTLYSRLTTTIYRGEPENCLSDRQLFSQLAVNCEENVGTKLGLSLAEPKAHMRQILVSLIAVFTLTLTTGCPPFDGKGGGGGGAAVDGPGPIVPWPPGSYGGANCGSVAQGANPSCRVFADMKKCLKKACEEAKDDKGNKLCKGSCAVIYYKDGCPTSRDKADEEGCVAGPDCLGRFRKGGFPIGQYVCTDKDPKTGKSPHEVERNRCKKAADAKVDDEPADDEAKKALAVGGEGSMSLLPWQPNFSEELQVYLDLSEGPLEPDSCPVPVATPAPTGECPEGTTAATNGGEPVCILVAQ